MRPTERCEILSAKPRLTTSRASSLWLQWVIGRPLAEGGSQARADERGMASSKRA